MARTQAQLCMDLAAVMGGAGGEIVTGTPGTDLTAGTFGAAALAVYEDDYFADWYGRFYSGPQMGTSFYCTDFRKTAGVVRFEPAASAAITAQDLFYMLPEFSADELIRALNQAIAMVQTEAKEDYVDESITLAASTYEYTIPPTLLYLDHIFQESGTAGLYSPLDNMVPETQWRILRGSPAKLWFDNKYVSLNSGRQLRLVGQKAASRLTADDDTTNINETFLIQQAKAFLHQSRIVGEGGDFESHRAQMGIAQAIADRERSRLLVPGRGWPVAAGVT